MIKYILKTVVLLFIVVPVFSQQLPQYSLYKLNDVIINPALISSKDYNQFSLMVRDPYGQALKVRQIHNLFHIITSVTVNLEGDSTCLMMFQGQFLF